jgi:hypothetical protein
VRDALARADRKRLCALLFGWFRAGGDALFVKKELMLLADQRLVCAQGAAVPSYRFRTRLMPICMETRQLLSCLHLILWNWSFRTNLGDADRVWLLSGTAQAKHANN